MTMQLDFEWGTAKAEANLKKHAISFEVATFVFSDADAVRINTTRAIDDETREKIIGHIDGRLFTVVFTMRDTVVRIISARRSNGERKRYDDREI